ncbi:MAG: hypothetical protein ABIY70_10960 [Capsulimonas sp.]|uniref:hypothetical protein n=1 Tax=Capsulimonas sp. TaxID=2494211 RepID=UPI003266E98A
MTGSKTRSALVAFSLAMLPVGQALAEDPPAVTQPGTSLPPSPANPIGSGPKAVSPEPNTTSDAPLPVLSLDFEHISGSQDGGVLEGTPDKPVRLNYGGEFFVQADRIEGDLAHHNYSATGNVKAYDKIAIIAADKLIFDGAAKTSVGENILLYQRPYRIHASRIEATPLRIVATDGHLTTTPPGVSPDFEMRTSKITLTPDAHIPGVTRGSAENASFYLFHNRILTLPRVRFRSGGQSGDAGPESKLTPSFGLSDRYGVFSEVRYQGVGRYPIEGYALLPTKQSPQVRVTTHQTLIAGHVRPAPAQPPRRDPLAALHQFEQNASPPLPYGDPLLFHDFLPEGASIHPFDSPWGGGLFLSEELAAHLSASGRRRDDLYVSRLPELRLDGSIPLVPVRSAPPPGDPVAFRQFLRRPVFYASAGLTTGEYHEQPTDIHGRRDRVQVGLYTRPWMLGKDTLFLPSIQNTYNHYDKSKSLYQYTQTNLAIVHYFTDRTALSFEYRTSKVTGDSPFNFDALDTSRELITRAQLGNHNFAVSGLVRYDLERNDVLDYRVTVAPTLHGFIPTFTYNFRDRSLNVNFEVEGITF